MQDHVERTLGHISGNSPPGRIFLETGHFLCPNLLVSAQESLAEAWVSGGLLQGWGTESGSVFLAPFEGGRHYLHYLHHSLVPGQTTGREHSPTHQQKIGLKID